MYLAFLRHAAYEQLTHCPSAHQTGALHSDGRKQAITATGDIRGFIKTHALTSTPRFFSSSLLRAFETCSIIKDSLHLGGEITERADLAERCVGNYANLNLEEIQQSITKDPRYADLPTNWKSDRSFRLPGPHCESMREAGQRVHDALQNIAEEAQDPKALNIIVGHGASFRQACVYLNLWTEDEADAHSMHYARPLYFKISAQGIWQHIQGDWKVRQREEAHD